MAYASRAGRAHASSRRPRAFAVCDRCGIWYNHHNLRFQFDWAGTSLVNKRILVCGRCLDTPQHQLRAIMLPADPVPILNARPETAIEAYTDYRVTSGQDTVRLGIPVPDGDTRIVDDGTSPRVTQERGTTRPGANAPSDDGSGNPATEHIRRRGRQWRRD